MIRIMIRIRSHGFAWKFYQRCVRIWITINNFGGLSSLTDSFSSFFFNVLCYIDNVVAHNRCWLFITSIHIVILKILNKPEEKMGILNKDIAHLPNTSGSLCQGLKLIGWKNSGRNYTPIFGHSYRGKKTKKNQIKLNIIGHSPNIIST